MLGHGELQSEVPGAFGVIGAHPVYLDGFLAMVIVALGDPLEDGSGLKGRLITLLIVIRLIRRLRTPDLIRSLLGQAGQLHSSERGEPLGQVRFTPPALSLAVFFSGGPG